VSNCDLLREKAIQLCDYCRTVGLPRPQCKIVSEYAVNFIWRNEGTRHVLSLYYKSDHQRWTPHPNTDWLKKVIYPQLQPFFEQVQVSSPLEVASSIANKDALRMYFAEALDCLSRLELFAHENINFSIICQLTKEAIKTILRDGFSYLDCESLTAMAEIPCSPSFSAAKEYLSQCLTLCHINKPFN